MIWIISLVFISRIKSREAQTKSEQQYKQLIDAAKSIILRWSPSGAVLFINPYGLQFFGYTAEELLGKNVTVLVPATESTGRDLTTLTENITRYPERFASSVNENVCKDGTKVWVSWTNHAFTDDDGKLLEILAIGNDVTELKRTEEQLQKSKAKLEAAMNSMTDAVFISDTEGRFIDFNDAFATFQKSSNKNECAKTLAEYPNIIDVSFLDGKPVPIDMWAVPRALRGEVVSNAEYILKRKDTGESWVGSFSFAPIRDYQGNIAGSVVVGRDITERKKAEQDLRESEENLRILNENLENLVIQRTEQVRALSKALTLAEQHERKQFSQILHENIQQKLFGARMLFKQYLRSYQSKMQSEEHEDIEDGIELLENALGTTKTLSIELNPPVLNTEGLDAALRWLVTFMHNTYKLNIDLQMHGQIEMVRNEAQLMLTQMVRYLLNNVIRHAGVLDAILNVECIGGRVEISVIDSGRGFNPSKVLSGKVDENRLGLLSIKERLKLFGGDLTLQSATGQGTRVTITLPHQGC
jgi:PAS domain S-box-containing protein